MPMRLGRQQNGQFAREYYCDSCEMLGINGLACHETGCPDAWKDYAVDCFQCGCEFKREERFQRLCQGCVKDNERGPDDDDNTD